MPNPRTRALPIGCAALLASLLGAACGRTPAIRPTVDAWLSCVECVDGELDSLIALAARAPATIDTLRNDLLQGPAPDRRAGLAAQLRATHQRLEAYRVSHPTSDALPYSELAYVAHYLGNSVAIYQGRAARALGAIGGERTREMLAEALRMPEDSLPPAVRLNIQFALDSVPRP